jgi:hypothetical protein
LVFIKGTIFLKHKSHLIKIKYTHFLYEFLKKKKNPITIVFHTPFKSSFKDKVMHVYVWKVGWRGRGEGGGTCMMSFLWQTPLSFSYVFPVFFNENGKTPIYQLTSKARWVLPWSSLKFLGVMYS